MANAAKTQGRVLIKGGWLITMDRDLGDLPRADVLIDGRKIVAVGPGLGVEDAEIIDGSDRISLRA